MDAFVMDNVFITILFLNINVTIEHVYEIL